MSFDAARRMGAVVVGVLVLVARPVRATELELLGNASFESPVASGAPLVDAPGAPWNGFNIAGSRVTSRAYARTGLQSVQTIGPFDFVGGGAGANQTVSANAGTIYRGSIFALNPSSDPLEARDFGFMSLVFLDSNENLVDVGFGAGVQVPGLNEFQSSTRLLASSPRDVWTPLVAKGTAPAGTQFVRLTFAKIQLGNGAGSFVGGTAYWDDASVMLVPEPGGCVLIAIGAFAAIACLRRGTTKRNGNRFRVW